MALSSALISGRQTVLQTGAGIMPVAAYMANMPEFATAFGCKKVDAMVSAQPCRIW